MSRGAYFLSSPKFKVQSLKSQGSSLKFPTVSREQAVAVLSASRESLLNTPTNTRARMELMSQAVNDELFLADLNATMEDFRDADNLEHPA